MYLPSELLIEIYMFLEWKDINKIEKNKDILMMLIQIYNPGKNNNYERIYKNVIDKKCFHCFHVLPFSYLLKVCYYCKYNIQQNEMFPMYCGCCVPLKKKRNIETRTCHICNNYCTFIGIEPYS